MINYRDQMNSKIITFPRVTTQRERGEWYDPSALQHPAKMSTRLAVHLILQYTKCGDVILDPMAGVGTTLVEAAKLNRNAVGIDIEKKYVEMMKKNTKQNGKLTLWTGVLRLVLRETTGRCLFHS